MDMMIAIPPKYPVSQVIGSHTKAPGFAGGYLLENTGRMAGWRAAPLISSARDRHGANNVHVCGRQSEELRYVGLDLLT